MFAMARYMPIHAMVCLLAVGYDSTLQTRLVGSVWDSKFDFNQMLSELILLLYAIFVS